jgi:hypothetical protein
MKVKRTNTFKVAKEIINIKFDSKMTINQCMKKFFDIMRKYGIKQGTEVGNSIIQDNFDWTMCYTLFIRCLRDFIMSQFTWAGKIPKDLEK